MHSFLTDTTGWSVIVGIVMPWLIAVAQQPQWSAPVRKAVAIACSVVGGLLTCLATGAFAAGPVTVIGACGIVLIASQAIYKTIAKPAVGKMRTELATAISRHGRHESADYESQP
jgi:hypothetical protein